MSSDLDYQPQRPWKYKFRDAFRGVKLGVRGQSSFFVHLFVAGVVVVAAMTLRVDRLEWCLLVLCIAVVLTAEMFNTALESMAKAITQEQNPHIGGALDMGSAAVLIASLGAMVVGAIVFLHRLALVFGGAQWGSF